MPSIKPKREHCSTTRREVIRVLSGTLLLASVRSHSASASTGESSAASALKFELALSKLRTSPSLVSSMRGERADRILLISGLERAPIEGPLSKTPIDGRATELIVTCEVGGESQYKRMYEKPTWPKGESGITIGVGYDVGYVTVGDLRRDWSAFLANQQLTLLSQACGKHGSAARDLLASVPGIVLDWSSADAQFRQITQPRYVGQTERALPNSSLLSATSLGALVSLVYNRGASFSVPRGRDPDNRFLEMRNIKAHMQARDFDQIPREIRAMKRIWKDDADMRGLLIRRDLEANLFQIGLASEKPDARPVARMN
jgi:GH24 family phage-related lysozyme (muramidase)